MSQHVATGSQTHATCCSQRCWFDVAICCVELLLSFGRARGFKVPNIKLRILKLRILKAKIVYICSSRFLFSSVECFPSFPFHYRGVLSLVWSFLYKYDDLISSLLGPVPLLTPWYTLTVNVCEHVLRFKLLLFISRNFSLWKRKHKKK